MATDLLKLGSVFAGKYLIERVLGQGGFATVYEAREDGTNRGVALKVLHPDSGDGYDPRTVARFKREAAVLAQLRSPHVVRLLDFGEDEALLYLATERLGGQDLSDYLKAVPRLDEDTAEHILRQLLDALEDAHNHGLLHRDIKPENIRILREGGDDHFVKLLDFGLARSTDDSHPSITRTGELVGTPRYMSPEQLKDQPLTAASDIYSLGVVLLELLVGRDALHGGSWGAQLDRLRTGHLLAAPMLAQISPGLRQVIGHMTAPHVSARVPTVAAVRRTLEGRDQTVVETNRASIGVPLIVGVLALAVVGAVVVASTDDEPLSEDPPKTRDNPLGARAEPAEPTLSTPDLSVVVDLGEVDAEIADHGSPGCGVAVSGRGRTTIGSMFGDGLEAYIPRNYDPSVPHPLVIMFHQWDETGGDVLDYSGFGPRADEDGVIIVAPYESAFPHRFTDPIRQGTWTKELAMSELCVDSSKIFIVGQSSGGEAAYQLACEPWVAGFATNAFRLKTDDVLCEPAMTKPHLLLMARDSTVAPFNGGKGSCSLSSGNKRSAVDHAALWLERNQCSGSPETITHVGGRCMKWQCAATFERCDTDGGQQWPGSTAGSHIRSFAPDCIGADVNFPTSEVVWKFLQEQIAED